MNTKIIFIVSLLGLSYFAKSMDMTLSAQIERAIIDNKFTHAERLLRKYEKKISQGAAEDLWVLLLQKQNEFLDSQNELVVREKEMKSLLVQQRQQLRSQKLNNIINLSDESDDLTKKKIQVLEHLIEKNEDSQEKYATISKKIDKLIALVEPKSD